MKNIIILLLVIFTFTNCSYAEKICVRHSSNNTSDVMMTNSDYLDIDSIKINGGIIEFKEEHVHRFNIFDHSYSYKLIDNNEIDMQNNRMKCVSESLENGKLKKSEDIYYVNETDISNVYVISIYTFLKVQNFLKNVLLFNLIVFILLLVFLVLFYEMKLKKIRTKNIESSNKLNI